MLTCLSACGSKSGESDTPGKAEPFEKFIRKWEVESYETSDGVFTDGERDWAIEGMIFFYNKDHIDVSVDATLNSADKNIAYFNDYLSTATEWNVLEDSTSIEITYDGHVVTTLIHENEKIKLTTQKGTFTLVKISDNPYEV